MRNLKKALALVLALMMALSLMSFASAAEYADNGDVTKNEAVDVMSAIKVFQGDNSGSFNPAGSLRRSEAAKIIAYMKLGPTVAEALPKDEAPFPDVKAERWHTGYIAYAKAEGIIDGRTNGNFDPDATLTGYEFGKMVLEAAGISGEYTGSNWKLNINTALRGGNPAGTDLMKGVDAVLSMPISRENACQMAFNGLNYTSKGQTTGNFVIHVVSGSTNPNKGQVPDGTVCASRTEALMLINMINGNLATNKLSLTADYTIDAQTDNSGSLAADVFKLTSDEGTDDFGAPAKVWKIDGKAAVTVANSATLSYTKAVKNTDIAKALNVNAANIDTVVVTDGKAAGSVKLNNAGLATIGGNGTKVDVYQLTATSLKIVVVNTYVGTIKNNSYKAADATKDQDEQVTITLGSVKPGTTQTEIEFPNEKFTKDDEKAVVLYTVSYQADNDYDVVNAEFPAEVTGTVTRSTASNFVMGGTTYNYGAKALIDNTDVSGFVTAKSEVTFYTDSYGYVVDSKEAATPDDVYAYVYDVATAGEGGWTQGATSKAKLLGLDGQMTEVTVSAVDDKTSDFSTELGNTKGDFVKVVADGDKVKLVTDTNGVTAGGEVNTDCVDDNTGDANLPTITRNTVSLGSATLGFNADANSKTVFLVTNANGVLTVYTGITTVPTITFAHTNARAVIKDGVAIAVYAPNATVVGGSSTATDITFIAGASASTATDADKGQFTTYNAVINGEITTIETAGDGLSLAGANKLYYSVSKNDKDLITSGTDLSSQITGVTAISKTGITAAPANGVIELQSTKYTYNDTTKVYLINTAGVIEEGVMEEDVAVSATNTVLGYTTNGLLTAIFVQSVPSAGDAALTGVDSTATLTEGVDADGKVLTATYNAGTSGLTVSSWDWTTSDATIATVTKDGTDENKATVDLAGGHKSGDATITVTATLSNGSTITATCTVTVKGTEGATLTLAQDNAANSLTATFTAGTSSTLTASTYAYTSADSTKTTVSGSTASATIAKAGSDHETVTITVTVTLSNGAKMQASCSTTTVD